MHQEGFNSETTLILQAFSRTRRGEEEKKKTKKKAAEEEEEDSESETEAILRAQVAARATAGNEVGVVAPAVRSACGVLVSLYSLSNSHYAESCEGVAREL